MKKRIVSLITAIAMISSMGITLPAHAETKTVVTLNPSDASPFNSGRFEGWGTSLCWWANRLGYSEKLTKAAADAFFSEDGLGLDIARYNLGGGDNPEHNHVTRSDSKVPGVWKTFELSEDGKDVSITEYDITKDQNQLNIAKAALAANPDLYFEGFSNSAPYFMTNSDCSSGAADANTDNLKADMYDDFGKFIADATKLFKEEGIEFKSYSPMNEPDTNYWGLNSPKQEGCHFDPGASQSNAIIETRKALDAAGLNDVLVAGMDETSIDKSVTNLDKLTDDAKTALGRIDTHTYSGSKRAQLKAKAVDMGKTLWMSEVDGNWDGAGLAERIITDINGMHAAAWVMWDIIDCHKDSDFTAPDGSHPETNTSKSYTDKLWGVGVANHDDETLFLTNKYYVFGQFSRYINPGDTIIASAGNTLAAYNKDTGAIKIVANNTGASDLNYEFDLSGFTKVGNTVKEIRTDMSGKEKWADIKGEAVLDGKTLTTTLKAHTVTTYVIGGEQVTQFSADADGVTYSYTKADSANDYDTYFAVYGKDGELRAVTKNKPNGKIEGDFTDCTFKLMVWNNLEPKREAKSETGENTPVDYAVITGSGTEIKRGTQVQLSLGTNLEGGVEWSVDNTQIASITADGLLTASKPGKVTVNAKVGDYTASKTFDITVYVNIIGANSVKVGNTAEFTLDTNAEGTPVWSVSDENIASITQDGVLTAKDNGEVTITVTIGEFTSSKVVKLTSYTLSGTPSWGSSSSAPKDSDDYRKAADGDLNTYFDGVKNGYVMYDYSKPVKINSVKLAARSGSGMPERTKGSVIQGSNDGIEWTDLYTLAEAIPAGEYTTVAAEQLADNNAYRYIRYTNPTEMTNIAEFVVEASAAAAADGEPTVTDIEAFTDDFENSSNIFGAAAGDLSADGNQIYSSGLERFGNVFVPVKATASAELSDAVNLSSKDRFRLSFNMFAGWESNGKENVFSIKDADDNEILGFTISGGGYNLNQMRIGGEDLLADETSKPIAQCNANELKNGALRGANGWGGSSQVFANNMGLNKTVEIIIDGSGMASVKLSGGAADLSYSGTINTPISIKSLVLTGAYNSSRGRVVSYDNFDADVITYSKELEGPAPAPQPTESPVLPDSGELISLNFDSSDLSSASSYGKAEGSPKFVEIDGKKCIQLDNTAATAVTLSDANGNGLLTGMEEFTISFKVKPAASGTSWWFYSAPSGGAQTYQQEKYLGCLTKEGTMTVERYLNSGSRLPVVEGKYNVNEWNDVIIAVADGMTTLYINGVKTEQTSSVNMAEMLGKNPVAYIGRANWGTGEYATGYIDDFVITKGVSAIPTVTLDNLTGVTDNITLPSEASDGSTVVWTSDNTDVIANDGTVTRQDENVKVKLTASIQKDGSVFTQEFTAVVKGYLAAADSLAAYSENGKIVYTSDYDAANPYTLEVTVAEISGEPLTTANGEFTDGITTGETYTLTYKLMSGTDVKKEVTRKIQVKEEQAMEAYLFAHFVGNESSAEQEQIYFSVSKDGTNWTTVNGGKPVLTSSVGENGVRDPYILRGEDGKFFVIATDLSIYNLGQTQGSNKWGYSQTNGSKSIVVWESDDLVTWSDAALVKVAPDNAGCTWAPEAVYDPEKDMYMVFWASKVSDDNYATQRIYRSYTKDFKTFTEPEIYIDGGTVSNIDTTIINNKGMYYRFTKNESKSTVTMMKCPTLSGEWETVDTYTLGDMTGYEGPTIYKLNGEDKWCLLLDYYSKSKGYKPFVTDDIAVGNFTAASDFSFDGTYRHGTVMPITQAEYDALTAK